ncbi:MAG TPA: hypothetical protein VFD52_03075 [Clostridia bacterium]|nr:hypothetical protein [Clostridia bacterium]
MKKNIISPYKSVDWDTWGIYKGSLHTHSSASDSKVDFKDMIEGHYEQGYDVLAMTDHGVVNRGWNVPPQTVPVLKIINIFNKPTPLSNERYLEITNGTDRGGRGMTDVKPAIELNAAVLRKNHVNGFFIDYGQNIWGKENDFEGPIAAVDKLGGISFINHPGDWIKASGDISRAHDPKNISFFADLLKRYHSCLGIEIFNRINIPTNHDRVIWDNLLQSLIPTGRNVWGFSNTDAHTLSDIDTSFSLFAMPENNCENVRTAMENGTFFAVSRYPKYELPADFKAKGIYPSVTRVDVDEQECTISIEGKDYSEIQWVANGKIIATGNTININDYEEQITYYVRAQLLGDGGVCLTQAFIVDDGTLEANTSKSR